MVSPTRWTSRCTPSRRSRLFSSGGWTPTTVVTPSLWATSTDCWSITGQRHPRSISRRGGSQCVRSMVPTSSGRRIRCLTPAPHTRFVTSLGFDHKMGYDHKVAVTSDPNTLRGRLTNEVTVALNLRDVLTVHSLHPASVAGGGGGAGGKRGSKPPWNHRAALLVLDLHRMARDLEAQMLADMRLAARLRCQPSPGAGVAKAPSSPWNTWSPSALASLTLSSSSCWTAWATGSPRPTWSLESTNLPEGSPGSLGKGSRGALGAPIRPCG